MRSRVWLMPLLVMGLAGCSGPPQPAPPEPVREAEPAWKANTGQVFERLRQVFPEPIDPTLRIEKAGPDPFAWATEGDLIRLSESAIYLCYHGVPSERGDARMAFVLAHELAHLAGRDFFHARAFRAIQSASGPDDQKRALLAALPEVDRAEELATDAEAVVGMALAGFDPRLLLDDDRAFFEAWERQSLRGRDEAGKRGQLLIARLEEVANGLPLFEAGAGLYQAGLYRQALPLFEAFGRIFPGPAVRNNLGLVHYQLASRRLAGCDGRLVVRFLTPVLLDLETPALRFTRGEGSPCYQDDLFERHRSAAERHFEAVQDRHPGHLPSLVNWASLMLLAGNGSGLLARVFEMEEADARSEETRLLEALGFYLRELERGGDPAAETLDALQALPASPESVYAQARVLQESGRDAEARRQWSRYLEMENAGLHAVYVREQLGMGTAAPRSRPADLPDPPAPLGPLAAPARSWLRTLGEPREPRAPGWTGQFQWYATDRYRALVLDGELLWVEETLDPPTAFEELRERWGAPERRRRTTRGFFASWGSVGYSFTDGLAHRRAFTRPEPHSE